MDAASTAFYDSGYSLVLRFMGPTCPPLTSFCSSVEVLFAISLWDERCSIHESSFFGYRTCLVVRLQSRSVLQAFGITQKQLKKNLDFFPGIPARSTPLKARTFAHCSSHLGFKSESTREQYKSAKGANPFQQPQSHLARHRKSVVHRCWYEISFTHCSRPYASVVVRTKTGYPKQRSNPYMYGLLLCISTPSVSSLRLCHPIKACCTVYLDVIPESPV